jgi:single-strand DNA-binding protein
MNGPQITIVGNVAASPRLRSLADGTVVADFRVAQTPSRYDKARESWVDLEPLWFSVSCWRTLAEHAALSFNKGDRVIVTGHLSIRSWTNDKGELRSSLEIDAASVGMDISRGPVLQKRLERTSPAPEEQTSHSEAAPSAGTRPGTGEVVTEATAPEEEVAA